MLNVQCEEGLRRYLERWSFKGAWSLLNPTFDVREWGTGIYLVEMRVIVPDRDTGELKKLIVKRNFARDWSEDQLDREMITWLRLFWDHEFHESINKDERRIKEVHNG